MRSAILGEIVVFDFVPHDKDQPGKNCTPYQGQHKQVEQSAIDPVSRHCEHILWDLAAGPSAGATGSADRLNESETTQPLIGVYHLSWPVSSAKTSELTCRKGESMQCRQIAIGGRGLGQVA